MKMVKMTKKFSSKLEAYMRTKEHKLVDSMEFLDQKKKKVLQKLRKLSFLLNRRIKITEIITLILKKINDAILVIPGNLLCYEKLMREDLAIDFGGSDKLLDSSNDYDKLLAIDF